LPRPALRRAPDHIRPTPDETHAENLILAGIAPEAVLARAKHCAEAQGVPALDALLACTGADPDEVTKQLSARLGVGVLREIDFAADILPANAASAAMQAGILRLPDGDFIVSVRGKPIVELARLIGTSPDARARMRIAPPSMFTAAVLHAAGQSLAEDAASGPALVDVKFSAKCPRLVQACASGLLLLGAAALLATLLAPLSASFAFGTLFMILTTLRLLAALGEQREQAFARVPDDLLPIYTVLVPLFRERACIGGLIRALGKLDYPETKLDLKLLVETGDNETLAALRRCALPNHFEILIVPSGEPRTKPRALNAGLAAARGSLLAVFDAEDRPDPGQLRAAVNAFERGGKRLACVQARLVIDNVADGWLTRIFALEYAGLFDALLPALSRSRLMFPLGGTSNHFRTAILDRAGSWDAWNVTEDADLGVRLARLGYRAKVISSATLEEAPNTTGQWLRQRTRWLKGYMLTWSVHMRSPARLYRDLGLVNFLAFHAFIGGVPVSALMLPIFLAGVASNILSGVWLSPSGELSRALPYLMDGFNLVLGFGTAMALAAIGADRRGLTRLVGWIPTVPVYWLLSSVAAWRAIWQLLHTPYLWEKTEHGLARTSQTGESDGLTDSA
jgi:cellulose synthase/poly-beta-1,6-N-acetylglucosamine synthase-like glycosyltransferase